MNFGAPARSQAAQNSGSNYGFSRTSSGQGNWNTGGSPTGFGSFAGGISQYGGAPQIGGPKNDGGLSQLPQAPRPMVQPAAAPAPGTTITDVFGPRVPMDPGIIAQMTRQLQPRVQPAAVPGSTQYKQPARGMFIGGINGGNDQFGHSFGGPRNNGSGTVGGGRGGGGGGGW